MITPACFVSQSYNWDGDPSVMEKLVFFGNTAVANFVQDGNPKHATFKLRSILTGEEGMYVACVRHPVTLELIYEFYQPLRGQHSAMNFLCDYFMGWCRPTEINFPNVPDKKGIADAWEGRFNIPQPR